jgi:D-xylose transport system ATP-binding protein
VIRGLRRDGVAVVYVSHHLDEVRQIADRITVLRDGAAVCTSDARDTNPTEVIRAMVGREITSLFPRRTSRLGDVMLRVRGLDVQAPGTRGGNRLALSGIEFDVREGEVLGIGGLMGAGRSELLMHLFGAWGRRVAGHVFVRQAEVGPHATPRECIRAGMVLVSEDRKRFGLLLDQTIVFNLTLSNLRRLSSAAGVLNHEESLRAARHQTDSLHVKCSGLDDRVARLSGGNQQKIVLGKALMTRPRILLLDEPTRGIDVGAKQEVYELIGAMTDAGHAVVLVSSELPELMEMSDRIIMLRAGRIGGTFARGEATPDMLLRAAMGEVDRVAITGSA